MLIKLLLYVTFALSLWDAVIFAEENNVHNDGRVERVRRFLGSLLNKERHAIKEKYKLEKRFLEAKKDYDKKCAPSIGFKYQSCPPLEQCIDKQLADNFLRSKVWFMDSLHEQKRKRRKSAYEAYESKCRGNILLRRGRACPPIDRVQCEQIALQFAD
ncbi:hypothetical protein GJ496_003536 [Pomphorhynchus laevis]|nr:hypothetical protein GJ496_003536 [Pomphorhynchus laevis]